MFGIVVKYVVVVGELFRLVNKYIFMEVFELE